MKRPALLFAGRVRQLPGDSQMTAMDKSAVAGRVRIDRNGLNGDEQADRRVHGGPDKALHFYPPEHYARLATAFPDAARLLVPGSIGENLSAAGLIESAVCLGDVFALGTARVEVCQPRQPCWKIDARYGVTGMTAWIATSAMTGGYLRVLADGVAESGDPFQLIDRDAAAPTLAEFWQVWMAHRPDPRALDRIARTAALSDNWRQKFVQRLDWLRSSGTAP